MGKVRMNDKPIAKAEDWRHESALGAYHWARDFVQAGHDALAALRSRQHENLRHHSNISPAYYFSFCHGIELAFKAFWLDRGGTVAELKKCGHDLESLMQRTATLGIHEVWSPSSDDKQQILLLNVNYQTKQLEYLKIGFTTLPHIDQVARIADSLLDALATSELEATDGQRCKPRRHLL